MRKHFAIHRLQSKIIISLIILVFLINTVSLAEVALQVPSKFNSILDLTGYEYRAQLDVEAALILAMSMREVPVPYQDINAALDQMYCEADKKRILDVVKITHKRKQARTVISLRIFKGPDKGKEFRLISTAKSVQDLQRDESNIDLKRVIKQKPLVQGKKDASLPLEEMLPPTENFVESFDGARIYYKVIGDGDIPITFLHYWGGHKEQWHRLIKQMQSDPFFKGRFKYILIDLRGFGKSDLRGKRWRDHRDKIKELFGSNRLTWKNYFRYTAQDIKYVLDEVGINESGGTHISGHSLGGMVAMQFGMDFPEMTKSLALIHTSSNPVVTFSPIRVLPFSSRMVKVGIRLAGWSVDKMMGALDSYLEREIDDELWGEINDIKNAALNAIGNNQAFWRMVKSIMMEGKDQDVVREVLKGVGRTNFESIIYALFAMAELHFSKKELKEKINSPVLVVRGMWDLVVGRKSEWAQHFDKDFRKVTVVDGKHMSPQENPEQLCAALIEFYEKVIGPPAELAEGPVCENPGDLQDGTDFVKEKNLNELQKDATTEIMLLDDGIYDVRSICKGNNNIRDSLALVIAQLDYESFGRSVEKIKTCEFTNIASRFYQSLRENRIYLAIQNGEAIGFLKYSFQADPKMPKLRGKLAVSPKGQGKGIARKLLDSGISKFIDVYPEEDVFGLVLAQSDTPKSVEENYFREQYFSRRGEKNRTNLPWYLEWHKPRDFSNDVSFIVKIHKRDNRTSNGKKIENRIKNTKLKTLPIFRSVLLGGTVKTKFFEPGKVKTTPTIDVVINPSIIATGSIEADIKIWARLMILCKEYNNLSLVINKNIYAAGGKRVAPVLLDEAQKVDTSEIVNLLRLEVKRQGDLLGIDEKTIEAIKSRIRHRRQKASAGSVEIPMISKTLAEWMRDNNIELGENQYPVVLEGKSSEDGDLLVLDNYQAALSIAISKAALVLAKRRLDHLEENALEEYLDLKEELLNKLNDLYQVIKKDMVLSFDTLDYLVSDESVHRLSRAIELFIPCIAKDTKENIYTYQERVLIFMQFA